MISVCAENPKPVRSFLHMLHAQRDDAAHMLVVQRVVDGFAFPPEADQLAALEQPQLVAD